MELTRFVTKLDVGARREQISFLKKYLRPQSRISRYRWGRASRHSKSIGFTQRLEEGNRLHHLTFFTHLVNTSIDTHAAPLALPV